MMILCPHCQTPYFAPDDLNESGRMFRCSVCGTDWLARSFAEDPYGSSHRGPWSEKCDLPNVEDAVVIEQIGRRFKPALRDRRGAGHPRQVIGGGRQTRRLKAAGAVFGVLAVALVLRATIVSALPDVATTAAHAAGSESLDLRAVNSELLRIGTAETLLVEGEIVNRADGYALLPPIHVSLKSADGNDVYTWTVEPDVAGLAPGKAIGFRSALASPPDASQVAFNLAGGEERVIGLH